MPENSRKPQILIADDEKLSREILREVLDGEYEFTEVSSAEEVLAMPDLEKFNLIISDVNMGGISGLEIISRVKKIAPDTIIIMVSGFSNIENAVTAMRAGAFDYLTKPFDFDYLETIVRRALEYQNLLLAKRGAEAEKVRLASIIESSGDAIVSQSFDGTILSWNKGAENLFGYTSEEAVGQNSSSVLPKERLNEGEEIVRKIKRGEHIINYETVRIKKDGASIPVSLTVSPIINDKDELIGISKIARDISTRVRAEEALRQSQERYRAFIEQSSEGIWRFEIKNPFSVKLPIAEQIEQIYRNTYLAECNDAMASQYGFSRAEELIGKRIDDFLVRSDPSNEQHLSDFIKAKYQITDTETLETDRHGQKKYFLNNLVGIIENEKLVRIWGTQRDITRVRETEQAYLEAENQRRQSQKIEAIGRLAGGVAHDFNNFLAVIMLHVDMLNLQLPAESPLRYRIGEIKSVTENAAAMVRQLLAFSRKQPMQPRPVVLNEIIGQFVKILRPLIGADITLDLDLDNSLGVCFVDHNQITQILMNLIVNAKDAMPNGGLINIKTANVALSEKTVHHKAQPPGSYVELIVADSGTGIDPKIQERVFEPFFTTKEIGKGTGLGLATVYGIVKQSNGFIWLESEVNEGTIFKIQFPRINSSAEKTNVKTADRTIPRGDETVLVVEDEDQVRRAAVEVLTTLGYQVFEASSGTQAIQLAELFTEPIHLLLTDVVMPRTNGKELADRVKSIHPETAILFMSGYTDDIIARQGILEENVSFLGKPFSHRTLAVKVREVLDVRQKSL